MPDTWFISDTHFFHEAIITSKGENGQPLRPAFRDAKEMNVMLFWAWNDTVKPQDTVYHLGDVAYRESSPEALDLLLSGLNGHKHLLLGNHDDPKKLAAHFETIALWRKFPEHGFFASHIPLLKGEFRNGLKYQVHGHLHDVDLADPAYINLCVEHHQFAPVHMDTVLAMISASAKIREMA